MIDGIILNMVEFKAELLIKTIMLLKMRKALIKKD